MIDWNHFTPLSALIGGAMIGLAAALFVLLNGRITGISGILGGLLRPAKGDVVWRLAFLLGLVMAPLMYAGWAGLPEITVDSSWMTLIVAGLFVGVGTRFGSGCTSGHGVCGLSRFSLRSLVATLCFMASGFATVYVIHHLVSL
jgi:uncharacterized membrane protein YedE/YeeE